ncbi:MAG: transposase, partial [Deltaproteobacteria bacterium]|nr:transposase [Deltaproteobacteria bacterium]
ESLKAGDRCPECERGKLYVHPPSVLVRVMGIAPLAAIAYELERLRCNACGEVFTAKAPEGIGEAKYDESATAMIALLKYGCGMPFNRLELLEQELGIPLPASTQWEVVAPAAAKLEPVFTELIRAAAQGDVLHNDDTRAKVLMSFIHTCELNDINPLLRFRGRLDWRLGGDHLVPRLCVHEAEFWRIRTVLLQPTAIPFQRALDAAKPLLVDGKRTLASVVYLSACWNGTNLSDDSTVPRLFGEFLFTHRIGAQTLGDRLSCGNHVVFCWITHH